MPAAVNAAYRISVTSNMYALRIIKTANPIEEIAALRVLLEDRDTQLIESQRHIGDRDARITQFVQQLETLQQQFLNLRRMHFGVTSEKFAGQADLKDVLGRIRCHRVDSLAEWLPFNWSETGA